MKTDPAGPFTSVPAKARRPRSVTISNHQAHYRAHTRFAESLFLDGNPELDVTINQPVSGPGSRFSLPAFVTLAQQAAQAQDS